MWCNEGEHKAVRHDGFVVRQVSPSRVVVTHQGGLSDKAWYTVWYGNPYTAFKPMPPDITGCCAFFVEGSVYEWTVYLDRATPLVRVAPLSAVGGVPHGRRI